MSAPGREWRSYHLFYHGDRDLVLRLWPTLAPLILSRIVDSFFFLRYSLGGPHIRIRLRLEPRLPFRSWTSAIPEPSSGPSALKAHQIGLLVKNGVTGS